MKFENWLAQGRATRALDTAAVIADEPLSCEWYRKGTRIGALTVRIAAGGNQPRAGRTVQSSSDKQAVTVIAPDDTPLRIDDTLNAGDGVIYEIAYVQPKQPGKTIARAYVSTQ